MAKKSLIVWFLCAFILGACSNTVSVKINNIDKSNLNNRLDDVPITVIIYKLNNIEKFQKASDKDLITREDGTLGKDKMDSIRLQVAPKDEIIAIKVEDKEVPYIGILVLFANSDKKITKIWAETNDASGMGDDKILTFDITQNGIKRMQ